MATRRLDLDRIPSACAPIVLRDLTGLSDRVIAKYCRARGWRPGQGMATSQILVAAAHMGVRFDMIDAPAEKSFTQLMLMRSWAEELDTGAWIVLVRDRSRGHAFGLFNGQLRGKVQIAHLNAPVDGLLKQGQ
jgi:hypothetical protein